MYLPREYLRDDSQGNNYGTSNTLFNQKDERALLNREIALRILLIISITVTSLKQAFQSWIKSYLRTSILQYRPCGLTPLLTKKGCCIQAGLQGFYCWVCTPEVKEIDFDLIHLCMWGVGLSPSRLFKLQHRAHYKRWGLAWTDHCEKIILHWGQCIPVKWNWNIPAVLICDSSIRL